MFVLRQRNKAGLKTVFRHAQVIHDAETRAIVQAQLCGQGVQLLSCHGSCGGKQLVHIGRMCASRYDDGTRTRMFCPFPAAQAGTAADADTAIFGIQAAAHALCMTVLENKGRRDIKKFKADLFLSQSQTCRRQGEFHISGPRKNNGPTDIVICQPSILGRVEDILPGRIRGVQGPAQQGMLTLLGRSAFAGMGIPAALFLPGVVRQANPFCHVGEEGAQIGLPTQKMETSSQMHQAGPVVVLAGQTGEYTPFNADSRQILPDVTLQDGMGADFDENTESKPAQLLDGGGEVYRLDISPPVLLVKAAAPLWSSADGRDEEDIRVPGRLKSMELVGKSLPD